MFTFSVIFGYIVVLGLIVYLAVTAENQGCYTIPASCSEEAWLGAELYHRLISFNPHVKNLSPVLVEAIDKLDVVEDRKLRELIAQNMLEQVTAWDSYAQVEKVHGHNGLVYYDHVLGRRCSIFVTKHVFNMPQWRQEQWLCIMLGYGTTVAHKRKQDNDRVTLHSKKEIA